MEQEEQVAVSVSTQPESTSTDYWNTQNAAAIPYNNPELKFNANEDIRGDLDFKSEDFQTYYNTQDGAGKRAMLGANNKSDAIKIAQRRDIFTTAQQAIEQDGFMTQIGMGLLPAAASVTNLLPFGGAFKAAQLAKTTSRIQTAGMFGIAGGATGATANILDEALFDIQGMPTNYLGAAAIGFAFGGGLGTLGGLIVGPNQKAVANSIDPKNDSFTRDFDTDPYLNIDIDENGVPKLQDIGQMDKSIIDKIPWLGNALRSDVHKVYQSEVGIIRGWMGRMANATTSLKDARGNLLPINKTGQDVKIEAKGVHNVLTRELTDLHVDARANGYTGDVDQFSTDIWKVYMEGLNRQKKEAAEFSNQKMAGMRVDNITDAERNALHKTNREAQDEYYTNVETTFRGDASLTKGAESYRKYFQDMLKRSQSTGIKELQGMHVNKLYAPRTYNYKAIKDGTVSTEQLNTQVRNGISNDSRNTHMTEKQLTDTTNEIVQMLRESAFDLNNLSTSFMVKDLPFSTHLQSKKLYLNESFMPDIVNSKFSDVTGAYHYKMSGRQATQYSFGTDNLEEVMQMVRDEYLAKGITDSKGEVIAFERIVKDLLGDLRMNALSDTPGWTFTRQLASYNSARLGGGFGGNQFIELAAAVMLNGTKAIFSGRMMKSLKTSGDLLYMKGKNTDEFTDYLIGSGYMEESLHTSRINRYADTEAGFNSGVIENKLNWANDKLMKYNGMRYFMGVMEDYTGSAIVTQLKAGGVDAKRLARWGLSESDAKSLGSKLGEVTNNDGWDLASLSTKEQDQLQLAISRGIQEVVVQGDSLHLPNWMKAPTPITKLLTQFLRFPLIAQETLTRRGFSEDQARMASAVLGSSVTYIGMKYLREQAAISLGLVHPIDAKYAYENYTDKDWMRVIGESLNYTAPLGFMGSVYNYGAIATGNNELGREWSSKNGMASLVGPTGGLGEDIIQILRATVSGDFTDERTLQRAKALLLFQNLPLISEAGKAMTEEYGR